MQHSYRKDISSLDEILSALATELAPCDPTSAAVYAVTLAVEELFTNMVKYSPPGSGTVGLAVAVEPARGGRRCRIALTEPGVPSFDPTRVPDVDTVRYLEERKIGGLGIHLVRRMVDDLEHAYRDGANVISFTKNLEC
jgi:serine/threonine-protein kinase RsbW